MKGEKGPPDMSAFFSHGLALRSKIFSQRPAPPEGEGVTKLEEKHE